ncbi:chaperone protein dnaJ-like protein [Tasmannia lanceolata]|uniref:chaperone protein dnaJ-like protein n=1 Tax=Tasmannia lanceolata TaxID=3420 RepID=UPI004064B0BC
MATFIPTKLNLHLLPSQLSMKNRSLFPAHCAPLKKSLDQDAGIICEPCNGRGWLVCDFCNGQKTNVKAENNRIYRRCPSCRAIGYVLCPECKVYKCVTFPDYSDGEL